MRFVLYNAIKALQKRVFINVLIILSLYAGFFLFFISCTYAESLFDDMHNMQLKRLETSAVVNLYSDRSDVLKDIVLTPDKIAEFLEQNNCKRNNSMVVQIIRDGINTSKKTRFFMISEGFEDFYNFRLLAGRFFTAGEYKTNAPVCVVEEYSKYKLGQTINLLGRSYNVVGIVKTGYFLGQIMVPGNDSSNYDYQYISSYEIAYEPNVINKIAEIDWSVFEFKVSSNQSAEMLFDTIYTRFSYQVILIVVAGLVILSYAIINILNIFINKMMEEKRNIGIRLALGATYGKVFWQFYFECLILTLISNLLIFISEPLIALLVRNILNHYFGPFTLVTMLTVSALSALIISALLMPKLKKSNVIKMIREP